MLTCLFRVSRGDTMSWKAKKILLSEINYFGFFLRSVIEAKSASLPFLNWKVCTITILLNALISIKNYARSWSTVWPTYIMNWYDFNSRKSTRLSCWCVLKYFKLKEIFSNRVKTLNAQTEGCRQTRFNRNIVWFILILR